MKKAGIAFGAVLAAAALFLAGYGYGRWYGTGTAEHAHEEETAARYYCPMHPNYTSDGPGDCPVCGMKLVPIPETDPGSAPAPAEGGHEGHGGASEAASLFISPEKQQLVGVRYGEAREERAEKTIRATGRVAFDETKIAKVQTRIDGWIEQVFIDFTGKEVKKGQPLLTLYSPELLASQQEYLLALESRNVLRESPLASARRSTESLIEAARRRLELWELSDAQIAQVESTGKPIRNITLYAPIGGYVTERNAFPKQRVTPDTELYTLVDLSRVWILASVFESEAGLIRMGMAGRVTIPYSDQRTLTARVEYIQPQIDPATRTLTVRLAADNPGLRLKPDMYVDVEFRASIPARIVVPREAVIDTGLRQTVFVDRGEGHLEPRAVQVDEYLGDQAALSSGLQAGERIVVSGAFLIDSEAQLRNAIRTPGGEIHQHD